MRVEAEEADRRFRGGIAAQAHAAEPARIREDELAAVVKDEMELREARRPGTVRFLGMGFQLDVGPAGRRVEAARHPEVHARPWPAIELEPEVFAVALDRLHA